MLKIVVGGQISKGEIAELTKKILQDLAEVEIKGDLEAANAVKSGQFDYYIGACNTGGGGALALAIALLGANKCMTISMPGKILPDEEIVKAVKDGKLAFGFTSQHFEQVLPVLLPALVEANGGK